MANEYTNQIRSNNEYHKVARQCKQLFELKMQDSIGEWGDYDEQELDRLSNLLQEYERLHPEVLPHAHMEMEEWPVTEAAHQRMVAPKWQPTREQQMWQQAITDLEAENRRLLGKNDRLQRKVDVMETARQQHFAERNELENTSAWRDRELRRWRRGDLLHDKHKNEIESLRHSASNYQELYEQRAESLEKAEAEIARLKHGVKNWEGTLAKSGSENEQFRAKAERLSMDLRKCREGRDKIAAEYKQFRENTAAHLEGFREQLAEWEQMRSVLTALYNAIKQAEQMLSVPNPTPEPAQDVDFEWVQRGFKHEPGGGINS